MKNNINLDAKVDNADIKKKKNQVTTLKQNELPINWNYFSNIGKILPMFTCCLTWFLKLKHNWISWKRNKPEKETLV